jgi:catecholate siderophore receptor
MNNQAQKKPNLAKSSLAVSIAAVILLPLGAMAQDTSNQTSANKETQPAVNQEQTKKVLDTVKVQATAIEANPNAQPGVPYKAQVSGDERHTRPLAETPQNISVLTKAQIEESGYTDLRQILDAQPGITLGTGENGNAFGDRYIIRGQEARSDVFVDGLRDPGMTTRESFAVEQIEISKGPNSSFAGRGTAGGAINAITKQAAIHYDFTSLSAGIGTDSHSRFSIDTNQIITDYLALRANLLLTEEDVPDRSPASRERQGAAISGIYEPTDKLELVLDYYALDASDNPDLGSYLQGTVPNRKPAENVPVYAQSLDFQDSDVDTFTARVKYRFNSDMHLTNITRKGTSENGYVVTGARFATTSAQDPNGAYATATLSTHQGWQEVDYLANQTNLFVDQIIAGMKHEFIFSAEYTDHSVLNGIYNVTNSGSNCITDGRTPGTTNASWCVFTPSGEVTANLNNLMNRQITKGLWDIDWAVKSSSLSVMDTVDLNDDWTIFAGLRADKFDFDLSTAATTTLPQMAHDDSDTLINGHIGITYDINSMANVYASFATASDINGGESDVGATPAYGGFAPCKNLSADVVVCADPELSKNIELGTKWNIFDEQLLLTAAIFQITKSDVMEGVDYSAFGTFNTGKNRVRGIEFGATGQVTDKLTLQTGLTLMEAEILEAAPVPPTAAAPNPIQRPGKTLSNFADNTFNMQLKYQFTDKFALGAAAKYESRKYAGQPDTAAAYDLNTGVYSQPVPAYSVFDMFAVYDVTKQMHLRLNVGNITNKDYYLAAYRSGSFLYKGDARTARITLNYNF